MGKNIFISLIKIYQRTLSFDHGPLSFMYSEGFCRFEPTCSQYSIDAILKFGVVKGTILGFYRVNRCNPWSKGGVDKAQDVTTDYFLKGVLLIVAYILALFVLFLISSRLLIR